MPFVLSPEQYALHQARVASQRSRQRDDEQRAREPQRERFRTAAEIVNTDQSQAGGVGPRRAHNADQPGSIPGPATPLRSGPPDPPGSPTAFLPARPAAPLRSPTENSLPTQRSGRALVLPWPPSGNTAVRHAQGAHYLRPEVAQYRRHVKALCYGAPPCVGRYILHVHLSPPDARRRDADNALKSLLDAMSHAGAITDDSMAYMRELHVTVDDARNGSAIVRVVPLDYRRGAA